jgi:hypothetical protein
MTRPAFTKANRYIFDRKALSWSIPSGHTCIGADICYAAADRETGKLVNFALVENRQAMRERMVKLRIAVGLFDTDATKGTIDP